MCNPDMYNRSIVAYGRAETDSLVTAKSRGIVFLNQISPPRNMSVSSPESKMPDVPARPISPFAEQLLHDVKNGIGIGKLSRFEQEQRILSMQKAQDLCTHEADVVRAQISAIASMQEAVDAA